MKYLVGGQALLDGIFMKTKNYVCSLVLTEEGYKDRLYEIGGLRKIKFFRYPFIRGITNLYEMLKIGMTEVSWSANQSVGEDENSVLDLVLTVFFSVFLTLFLFAYLPWLMAFYVFETFQISYLAANILDAVLKILILVLYIVVLRRFVDFQEMFKYHGAEHKAINCYESKKKLTVKNCRDMPVIHPRCGTTFVILVFVFSILFYSFIPSELNFYVNLVVRIFLIPVIAMLTYELLQLQARSSNVFVKFLSWPGLQFQKLTTIEPEEKHLDLAVKCLKKVLAAEKGTIKTA